MDATPAPVVIAQEVRIVDAEGRARISLSAASGQPVVTLSLPDGRSAATIALNPDGYPSVRLAAANGAPSASLEIDDKGAHVKFDRPGGGSSYLFLNNQGVSGVVLIDTKGARRLAATVGADGTPTVEQVGGRGRTSP